LPADYSVQKVYLGIAPHGTTLQARTALLAALDAGSLLVNYIGHAAPTQWADERLFRAADVVGMANGGRTPVMLPMTCFDGFYHYPHPPSAGYDATAEVVTRAAGKGAVASWSATGLGVATGHDRLNRGFFEAVFDDGLRRIGEATMAGKIALWATGYNADLLDTYLLFGDPATRWPLAVAPADIDLTVSKGVEPDGPFVPGDTLTYRLTFGNQGIESAQGVVITDSLPVELADAEIVSASEAAVLRPGSRFVWDLAELAPGAVGEILLRATISPTLSAPASIVNGAQIDSATIEPMPENNLATVSVQVVIPEPEVTQVRLPLVLNP
jgi:uncharacterized repeat protein (TIGR01451 family)